MDVMFRGEDFPVDDGLYLRMHFVGVDLAVDLLLEDFMGRGFDRFLGDRWMRVGVLVRLIIGERERRKLARGLDCGCVEVHEFTLLAVTAWAWGVCHGVFLRRFGGWVGFGCRGSREHARGPDSEIRKSCVSWICYGCPEVVIVLAWLSCLRFPSQQGCFKKCRTTRAPR